MSTSATDLQNALFLNITNLFNSLSFYSPIIICVSILVFSMFTGTMEKVFVFFGWIFLITCIRLIASKGFPSQPSSTKLPPICLTGLTELLIPEDVTYSTYILSFTMMYFVFPMIMVSSQYKINAMNYSVLAFFIAYIILDLFVKKSLSCINGFLSKPVLISLLGGLFLGSLISGILMYGTTLKKYLYINEVNSNKEVCSMPSKQQFKCRLYRNGELVGNL